MEGVGLRGGLEGAFMSVAVCVRWMDGWMG
jgi:hypothetical protein